MAKQPAQFVYPAHRRQRHAAEMEERVLGSLAEQPRGLEGLAKALLTSNGRTPLGQAERDEIRRVVEKLEAAGRIEPTSIGRGSGWKVAEAGRQAVAERRA